MQNLWSTVARPAPPGDLPRSVDRPTVTTPKVVIAGVWRLDELITIEYDGFAYADSYEDGRFVGLTTSRPTAVRQGGLLVDPKVAIAQIEQDQAHRGKNKPSGSDANDTTPPDRVGPTKPGGDDHGPTPTSIPTRFHATKTLTSDRVVRDVGQIYEEIIRHFVTTNGVAVKVTLDVESQDLDKLTADQRTAISENLNTLGFTPDNWSMD